MTTGLHFDDSGQLLRHHLKHHCIMGNDYYTTNEHRVTASGEIYPSGEVFGYDEITRQYFNRYRIPHDGPTRFADRVVIVTDAVGGICLAKAKRFRSKGARVVIADLKRPRVAA